jgi:hypothetical protein
MPYYEQPLAEVFEGENESSKEEVTEKKEEKAASKNDCKKFLITGKHWAIGEGIKQKKSNYLNDCDREYIILLSGTLTPVYHELDENMKRIVLEKGQSNKK